MKLAQISKLSLHVRTTKPSERWLGVCREVIPETNYALEATGRETQRWSLGGWLWELRIQKDN